MQDPRKTQVAVCFIVEISRRKITASDKEDHEGEKRRRSFLTTCGLTAAAAASRWPHSAARRRCETGVEPSALRITELKCDYVRGGLFVKVHTNQGVSGCGEGVDAIGGTY